MVAALEVFCGRRCDKNDSVFVFRTVWRGIVKVLIVFEALSAGVFHCSAQNPYIIFDRSLSEPKIPLMVPRPCFLVEI